jgi:hypothetical protein
MAGIIYSETHKQIVAERIASGQEPYRTLFERICDDACKPMGEHKSHGQERENGKTAKAAAFFHWLNRDYEYVPTGGGGVRLISATNMGDTAYQALKKLKTGTPAFIAFNLSTILHMSESLTSYAQAYLFLASASHPHVEQAGDNLRELAKDVRTLVKRILGLGPFIEATGSVTKHNYLLKASSALGLAGVILEEWEWVKTAQEGVDAVREEQGAGWAEGANYFQYAAVNFLPFFIALHQRIIEKGSQTNGEWRLKNYLNDPAWRDVMLWFLKTRLPSGERAGVDDARYIPFYSGLFCSDPSYEGHVTDHFGVSPSLWAWDWERAKTTVLGNAFRYFSDDLSVDMLMRYDAGTQKIEPHGPDFAPSLFDPENGQAVLRSGWNEESVYLLLLGERGRAATAGGGHEHNDGASFILHAYGELLVLDPGYPSWDRREETNKPEHHSRILIDGFKPEKDASLENFFALPNTQGVRSSTGFEKEKDHRPTHQRNVIFIHKRFFVLDDVINDAGGNNIVSHVHGFAGDDLEGTRYSGEEENAKSETAMPHALWQRPNAELRCFCTTSLGQPARASDDSKHGIYYYGSGSPPTPKHKVLKLSKNADSLRFLTLLYPQRAGMGMPKVDYYETAAGSALLLEEFLESPRPRRTYMASKNLQHKRLGINKLSDTFGQIEHDGNFFLLVVEPIYDLPEIMYCDGVSQVVFRDQAYFMASAPFHGVLEWDHANAALHGRQLSGSLGVALEIRTKYPPMRVAGAQVQGFDAATGLLKIALESPSQGFEIHFTQAPFHRRALMATTGIHPLTPYGDGEIYAHDGAGALLARSQKTGHFSGYDAPIVEVTPQSEYELTCSVMTELESGYAAASLGRWQSALTHSDFGYLSGKTDFQPIGGTWLSPAGNLALEVKLFGSPDFAGKAWFKDAVLQRRNPQNLRLEQFDRDGIPSHFKTLGSGQPNNIRILSQQPTVLAFTKTETNVNEYLGILQSHVLVVPGKTYRFSFELKVDSGQHHLIFGGMGPLQSDLSNEKRSKVHAPVLNEWQRIEVQWTAGKEDTLAEICILAEPGYLGRFLVRELRFAGGNE